MSSARRRTDECHLNANSQVENVTSQVLLDFIYKKSLLIEKLVRLDPNLKYCVSLIEW